MLLSMCKKLFKKIKIFSFLVFFIMKENHKGRQNFWKVLCTQYVVLWCQVIKKLSRATEFFIRIIYKILNIFIKNKIRNYNPRYKTYDRELRAIFSGVIGLCLWLTIGSKLIIGLNSETELGLKFLILFVPFLLYLVFPFFCFLITIFRREIKKHDERAVFKDYKVLFRILFTIVFCISFLFSLVVLFLVDDIRYILICFSFCLYSSIVNVFGLIGLLELINEVFYTDKLPIKEISDTEISVLSLILFLINIPLIYRFQSLLERLDARWKKIDLMNSQLVIQGFAIITLIFIAFLFSLVTVDILQFKIIAIILVFSFYLFFILIHSYKVVSQKNMH